MNESEGEEKQDVDVFWVGKQAIQTKVEEMKWMKMKSKTMIDEMKLN